MNFRKRTYASLLLVIFALVSFHDLLPHAHHDHDSTSGQSEHHQDHHEHDHDGLLAVMGHMLHLHQHTHSDCAVDVCQELPAIKQNKRDSKDNPNDDQAITTKGTNDPVEGTIAPTDIIQYRSNTNAFLKGMTTRGPPNAADC